MQSKSLNSILCIEYIETLMDFGQCQTVLDKAAAQMRTTGCSSLVEAMFFCHRTTTYLPGHAQQH